MRNILAKIIEILNGYRYRKFFSLIQNRLSLMTETLHLIDTEINKINSQNTFIAEHDAIKIKENFLQAYTYLKLNAPYEIDSYTMIMYNKNPHYVETSEPYQLLYDSFNITKNKLLCSLASYDRTINEVNNIYNSHSLRADTFLETIFHLRKDYFTQSKLINVLNSYRSTYEYFKQATVSKNKQNIINFLNLYNRLPKEVPQWNDLYVRSEIEKSRALFDNIDGKSLDRQQRIAAVTDEDNNLILAGAGCGKTLTIAGKVKYLVDIKGVDPDQILLISFTRKAADEMLERIQKKLNINVEVRTFHGLGLEIIANHRNKKPDILDDMKDFINVYFHKHIFEDSEYLKKMIHFFGYYIEIPKDISEFDSLGDYHDYFKRNDFETIQGMISKESYVHHNQELQSKSLKSIKGETVKSVDEMMIANFLFLNGIEYEYERPYEVDTSNCNRQALLNIFR